jgi:hypothetical protein
MFKQITKFIVPKPINRTIHTSAIRKSTPDLFYYAALMPSNESERNWGNGYLTRMRNQRYDYSNDYNHLGSFPMNWDKRYDYNTPRENYYSPSNAKFDAPETSSTCKCPYCINKRKS